LRADRDELRATLRRVADIVEHVRHSYRWGGTQAE
jgi:hypothetical protein